EMQGESTWLRFPERTRSAICPPQPRAEELVRPICQRFSWSLCEYSCGGRNAGVELYSALLIGRIRVPILLIRASLPWLYNERRPGWLGPLRSTQLGCKASLPLVSLICVAARAVRAM